ncbi:transposase [Rhodobacter sp. NSM]|uniref:transposase n=1 Tax=Rhodobacter sp. NSM TaxID=3457501 RepID=UPI003FD0D75F
MTAPGVGPITAMAVVAAFDDASRFRRSSSAGAHIGLTPRQCLLTAPPEGHQGHTPGARCQGIPTAFATRPHDLPSGIGPGPGLLRRSPSASALGRSVA